MSCRYNAQQRPLTTIADASAPLADLTFPALTICNVNQVLGSITVAQCPLYPSTPSSLVCPVAPCVQVKRSELARANTSGLLSGYTNTYLINHFLIGQELQQQPDNWTRYRW